MSFSISRLNGKKTAENINSEVHSQKKYSNAMTCPDTGILNRSGLSKYFYQIVPSELKKLSMVLITIDDYETINQKLSKSSSTDLLQRYITEVNALTSENCTLSRWSPSTFILICLDTTLGKATELSTKIRRIMQNKTWEKPLSLTCSTGVTQSNGETLHDLVKITTNALESLKKTNVNKTYVATHTRNQPEVRTTEKEQLLTKKSVLSHNELNQYFEETESSSIQRMSVVFITLNIFEKVSEFTEQDKDKDNVLEQVQNNFLGEINHISRVCDVLGQWSENEYMLVCPSTSIYHASDIAKEIKTSLEQRSWLQEIDITCNTDIYDRDCSDSFESEVSKSTIKNDLTIPTEQKPQLTELTCANSETINNDNLNKTTSSVNRILDRTGLRNYVAELTLSSIQAMSVVFIEIGEVDKIINHHGNETFNQILQLFTAEIQGTISSTSQLVSWNPNEYMVICQETSLEEAVINADKIRSSIQNKTWYSDIQLNICTEVYDHNCDDLTSALAQTTYDKKVKNNATAA